MKHKNLEQRMANNYLDMFPPFYPCNDIPIESQEQFYMFMHNVYQTTFDSPEDFFSKILDDDAYPNRFNRASYGKPELWNHMKKDLKEIDDFLLCLYDIGRSGELTANGIKISSEIKKKQLKRLPLFGLTITNGILKHEKYDSMFIAWKHLSVKNDANVTKFSRCMFDKNHSYMEDIYSVLYGNEVVKKLSEHLLSRRYVRYELARGNYTLDYAKNIANKAKANEAPLGNSLFGDPNHIGFAFEYSPFTDIPQYTVLRIVKMKEILLQIDKAPVNVKEFIVKHQKKCDNCGYCTQTDKSGRRPKQSIIIDDFEICALYPGFNFCFTQLDEKQTLDIIDFIEFMEKIIA